jgi:hypothetical protein
MSTITALRDAVKRYWDDFIGPDLYVAFQRTGYPRAVELMREAMFCKVTQHPEVAWALNLTDGANISLVSDFASSQ